MAMTLKDFKWFNNPRGLHNTGVFKPFILARYTNPQMGWAKLIAGGNEYVGAAEQLLEHNCMPIIRTFRENMGAMHVPKVWYENYKDYVKAGCYWFELYNEPNLAGEWPQNATGPTVFVSYENEEEIIKPMCDNWLEWAEKVINLGGYPGFPAMADSADHRHATTGWLEAMLRYFRENHELRFRNVATNGMWCATHPYIANHFYQEPPGGPDMVARPYYQERASEPGWHFEYPYDPLQQRHDPGRTVFGGTKLTPDGDPNGLVASGEAFQQLLKIYFDVGPVPVVGTEGGIWKIPHPSDDPHLIDTRFPPYSHDSHAEATLAMFEWIAEKAPPWFFGLTLWAEDDYYDLQGTVKAVKRLITDPPKLKKVPAISTAAGVLVGLEQDVIPTSDRDPGRPRSTPTRSPLLGPGPIVGAPDLHWVMLAPGLQADWFFHAAKRYWQTFRPTVLTDWSLIQYVPFGKSLAVTVLARTDTMVYMESVVKDEWKNILYDPVVADSLEQMKSELDKRAELQARFG